MNPPVITAIYAGLNMMILLWLAAMVIRRRFAANVLLGDGGDKALMTLIRGHGNAAEIMPMTMLMLLLADLTGAPAVALHVTGALFTIGRFMHAVHFLGWAGRPFRFWGMVLTLTGAGCLGAGVLLHALVMV